MVRALLADTRATARVAGNQLQEERAFDWAQVKAAVLDWQVSALLQTQHPKTGTDSI